MPELKETILQAGELYQIGVTNKFVKRISIHLTPQAKYLFCYKIKTYTKKSQQ